MFRVAAAMRVISLAILAVFTGSPAMAGSSGPVGSELPKDIELQEQFILVSAKLKNLSEVQDLMLKQQQLLLQHLEELRKEVDHLKQFQTNQVSRSEWESCLAKVDSLRKHFEQVQETNAQALGRLTQELAAKSAPTNAVKGLRIEAYRVQPGDTLSKIVVRLNEMMDKNGLPRLTQEQVESANPTINPDKIRAGQTILVPVPDKP
jgi:hypothetical protein